MSERKAAVLLQAAFACVCAGALLFSSCKSTKDAGSSKGDAMALVFDETDYVVRTVERGGKTLTYRAFEDIPYVANPADPSFQRLNIYAPEVYFAGGSIGGWELKSAPIFLPNTVGGYMPGPRAKPGDVEFGRTNSAFYALLHGYVVVSAGVRGRGMKGQTGEYIGVAPAAICDLKAAVRYLRANSLKVPGNTDRIISNGTSAGGALSALLGATGNHSDYTTELQRMGAADARDDIFAASCYCPITNLDHADMAYEWEFAGQREFTQADYEHPGQVITGTLTDDEQELSVQLAASFPAYLNGLHLADAAGNELTLDDAGEGSFKDYVASVVLASSQRQLDAGVDLSGMDWLTIQDGRAVGMDFALYVAFRGRMKRPPAFDSVNLGTPENELFGTSSVRFRHFTAFSKEHSNVSGEIASEQQIKMMNPMNYIGDAQADTARHFRIRHGTVDRDTSLAVSAMLAARLAGDGVDVDFAYPWGVPHSGDYDLDELFAWIDQIAR